VSTAPARRGVDRRGASGRRRATERDGDPVGSRGGGSSDRRAQAHAGSRQDLDDGRPPRGGGARRPDARRAAGAHHPGRRRGGRYLPRCRALPLRRQGRSDLSGGRVAGRRRGLQGDRPHQRCGAESRSRPPSRRGRSRPAPRRRLVPRLLRPAVAHRARRRAARTRRAALPGLPRHVRRRGGQ